MIIAEILRRLIKFILQEKSYFNLQLATLVKNHFPWATF